MADLQHLSDHDEDENNEDTFGFSVADTNSEWVPDSEGMDSIKEYLKHERDSNDFSFVGSSSMHGVDEDDSEDDGYNFGHSQSGNFGKPVSSPFPNKSSGKGAESKKKSLFDFDDDIDTLLTLKSSDLLRIGAHDEADLGEEVNMINLMRSVMVDNSVSRPPGLSGSQANASGYSSAPPGMGMPSMGNAHPHQHGFGMSPAGQAAIGSPSRNTASPQSQSSASASQQSQNVVPPPPQLSAEQLAQLTPQQLMHMEQWNLLWQQQQMRSIQEQQLQQQEAQKMVQRQQQQMLMLQHQQMMQQQHQIQMQQQQQQKSQISEKTSDVASETPSSGPSVTSKSKANSRGKWAGSRSKHMSVYEIDMVIRAQQHQVATENPFLDDYYNQNVRIMLDPSNYATHRPICDVAPPKKRVVDPTKKDPLAGSLGRLASGSSRAPRIMVVIDNPEAPVPEPGAPFEAKLHHLSQKGGINVPEERRVMLAIEDAFVILLELEDLKQLQHLHMHAAKQNPTKTSDKERESLEEMIIEHLSQIVRVLGIPKVGTPEADTQSAYYPKWEKFILAVLKIPKGSRMLARLLPLLPGTASLSLLKVFARHITVLAAQSLQDEQTSLLTIADYLRRVLLKSETDLLSQILNSILQHSDVFFSKITSTLTSKIGCFIVCAILCAVNDLKGRPDLIHDSKWIGFLPTYLMFHSYLLEALRGHMSEFIETCTKNATLKQTTAPVDPDVTIVAPPTPKGNHPPVNKITKLTPYTTVTQIWELLFYLTLSAQPQDKKAIHNELARELSIESITPSTPIDIVNLKTTFIGVLAQQVDPGFNAMIKQAQQQQANPQQQLQQQQQQPNPHMMAQQQIMSQFPVRMMGYGQQHTNQMAPPHGYPPTNQMMPPPGMMHPPPNFPMGHMPSPMMHPQLFPPLPQPGNHSGAPPMY